MAPNTTRTMPQGAQLITRSRVIDLISANLVDQTDAQDVSPEWANRNGVTRIGAIEYQHDGAQPSSMGAGRWAYRLGRGLAVLGLAVLFDAAVVGAVLFATGIIHY